MEILWESMESDEHKHARLLEGLLKTSCRAPRPRIPAIAAPTSGVTRAALVRRPPRRPRWGPPGGQPL